jgi:predicted ATPase
MPPSLSQPLSSLIHSKTGGVILFVNNFLKSLHETGLIRFSRDTWRWEFDLYKIRDEKLPSDIVTHLAERIMRLPENVQMGLQIASCLGLTFWLETFKKVHDVDSLAMEDFLITVTNGGFIQENFPTKGQYTWGHDQLKLAAYSLIPPDKNEPLHLVIGTRMYMKTPSDQLHLFVHDIVRNMNLGVRLLRDIRQRTELARVRIKMWTFM